jgi:hypothetical protein
MLVLCAVLVGVTSGLGYPPHIHRHRSLVSCNQLVLPYTYSSSSLGVYDTIHQPRGYFTMASSTGSTNRNTNKWSGAKSSSISSSISTLVVGASGSPISSPKIMKSRHSNSNADLRRQVDRILNQCRVVKELSVIGLTEVNHAIIAAGRLGSTKDAMEIFRSINELRLTPDTMSYNVTNTIIAFYTTLTI